MPELKPCPFCGNNKSNEVLFYGQQVYGVVCDKCEATGPTLGNKTIEAAIVAWNKRGESCTK